MSEEETAAATTFSSPRPPLPAPPPANSSTSNANKQQTRRPTTLPNDIKCVLLQGFGSIKQLKAISIPRPKPGEGEVLVHVKSW